MKKVLIAVFTLIIFNQAQAAIIGNDIENRDHVDNASNIHFIDRTLSFTFDGVIESWDIYSGRNNSEFALQVFRNTGTINEYELIGENYFSTAGGLGALNFSIIEAEQIHVKAGDVIGWWYGNGAGVIDFDGSGAGGSWASYPTTALNIGESLTFNNNNRTYSISANVVPEPSIIALMGLGILGLGLSRRKMKK